MTRVLSRIQNFLRLESASGILLMGAAVLALIAANSALASYYESLLDTPFAIQIGEYVLKKPLLLWINDGLMAVFFFLVGLELKREILEGELSGLDKAALPMFAAIGGMAVPALIYAALNWDSPETRVGWAIPAATDIAFALGLLAVLGSRIPPALKVLLLAIAIFDDLGAVIIIALFYTAEVSTLALMLAGGGLATLVAMNRFGVKKLSSYALVGLFTWACVLESGVHATLAGFLVALTIPMQGRRREDVAPLHRAEHGLHPHVAYFVLPVFAFANAGVSFAGVTPESLLQPVPLGIAAGLFFGKQIGVLGAMALAVRLNFARLPDGVSWAQAWGISCFAGIGFTMSLFIGTLAFDTPAALNDVRLGVLTGTLLSAAVGYLVLSLASGRAAEKVGRPAGALAE